MQKILKEELGQVFTPLNIASLMAFLLLQEESIDGKTILDPCIGQNMFLNTITKTFDTTKSKLVGIEIDEKIVDKNFFKDNRELKLMNFFDLSLNNKYDYIIMNPPYVRHEVLSNSTLNNKSLLEKTVGKDIEPFKGRANLYIYFIIKTLKHLKKGGKLIALTYDSWLYTEYGNHFKKYLESNYQLKTIIHFRKSVFDDVNIGATVIEILKDKNQLETKYIELNSAEDIPQLKVGGNYTPFIYNIPKRKEIKETINFESSFFETVQEKYPKVRRGIETLGNKFFYLSKREKLPFTYKVIKETKHMKNYIVEDDYLKDLLIVPKDQVNHIPKKLSDYFNNIKKDIEDSKINYLTLRKKVQKNDQWYIGNLVQPGELVFNYYFRKRIDFILNPKRMLAANNFYILDSNKPFLDLALLNSTFTKISILNEARDQGRGLKKIQLYEFRKVKIPNSLVLTEPQKKQLNDLGIKLTKISRSNDKPLIKEIDNLLLKSYNHYSTHKINQNQLEKFNYYG